MAKNSDSFLNTSVTANLRNFRSCCTVIRQSICWASEFTIAVFWVPTRNTLRSRNLEFYARNKKVICNTLKGASGQISIATDIWTSELQYVCLTRVVITLMVECFLSAEKHACWSLLIGLTRTGSARKPLLLFLYISKTPYLG